MAQTAQTIGQHYPRPASCFLVSLEHEDSYVRFARVSGLEREVRAVTYRHGLSFLEGEQVVKFAADRFITITLEQGIVSQDAFLHSWLNERSARSMSVSMCNQLGVPLVSWNIARAVAVKVTGPSLDADSNSVAIEKVEVMAAGIRVEHH